MKTNAFFTYKRLATEHDEIFKLITFHFVRKELWIPAQL